MLITFNFFPISFKMFSWIKKTCWFQLICKKRRKKSSVYLTILAFIFGKKVRENLCREEKTSKRKWKHFLEPLQGLINNLTIFYIHLRGVIQKQKFLTLTSMVSSVTSRGEFGIRLSQSALPCCLLWSQIKSWYIIFLGQFRQLDYSLRVGK